MYTIKEEKTRVKENVTIASCSPQGYASGSITPQHVLHFPGPITLEDKGVPTKLGKTRKDPLWNILHRLTIITLREYRTTRGVPMISLQVNGKRYEVEVGSDVPLLWVIREYLRLTGTKFGCGIGLCGSCTVHIDGKARRSCQIPVADAQGSRITTIEGLPEDHPVKRAWIEEQVPQCGYCQPGQIMQAAALLSEDPNPSEERIIRVMDEILCRCGTYPRIKRAVKRAIKEREKS